MIELKEHNIRPYEELCRMLEEHDKCAYVSATGTGKSYVIGKYIEEHDLVDKTLMLVPSNAIKKSWQKLLPGLEIISYQWLLRRKPELDSYALIVCDEMHHLGAEKWGSEFEKKLSCFSGRIIGTSATPVRFLDQCRDMAKEFFEDNVVRGLDLPKAIDSGILPSFEYTTALFDMPKRATKYYSSEKITEKLFKQLEFAKNEYSFRSILKKTITKPGTKVAVFVNSISEINTIKIMIEDCFSEAGHFVAHSNMNHRTVEKVLSDFSDYKNTSFIYTVDLFNEGVHIEGVNAVVMFRKTKSPLVYLQQIGRALSADKAKEKVQIIDFVANHTNLRSYKSVVGETVGWMGDEITNPERQIIVNDYALDELELLEKLDGILSGNWTEEEDNVLRDIYNNRITDNLLQRLPGRSEHAIHHRARILGIAKKDNVYSKEFYDDFDKYYPIPKVGVKFLREKYPCVSTGMLHQIAKKRGVHCNNSSSVWTEEEDNILRENASVGLRRLQVLLPQKTANSISYRKKVLGLCVTKEKWSKVHTDILLKHPQWSPYEFAKVYQWRIDPRTIELHRLQLGLSPMIKRQETSNA